VIHGAVVLSGDKNGLYFTESYGFADAAHTVPMTPDTIIDVASVTKVAATVTALLAAHARGLIDFDEPFTKYLPEYTPVLKNPPTVRELANHISGFTEDGYDRPYFDESGVKMMKKILSLPPPCPRTPNASYACWNYLLLGQIADHVLGMRLADFMQEQVFSPLEMESTFLGTSKKKYSVSRFAQTTDTPAPGIISDFVSIRLWANGITAGNAGLFSTANDLVKLLRMYLNHGETAPGKRLFGDAEINEIAPDTKDYSDGYRRFGWVIAENYLCREAVGSVLFHSGWSGQSVFLDMKSENFFIILTTRCKDFDRAKQKRFEIFNDFFLSEKCK